MRETLVNFVKGEDYIYYASSEATEIRYIKSLLKEDVNVELMFDYSDEEEGMIEVKMPRAYFKRPKAPRKMSEEQKQKASERFKKMWADKKEVAE